MRNSEHDPGKKIKDLIFLHKFELNQYVCHSENLYYYLLIKQVYTSLGHKTGPCISKLKLDTFKMVIKDTHFITLTCLQKQGKLCFLPQGQARIHGQIMCSVTPQGTVMASQEISVASGLLW